MNYFKIVLALTKLESYNLAQERKHHKMTLDNLIEAMITAFAFSPLVILAMGGA